MIIHRTIIPDGEQAEVPLRFPAIFALATGTLMLGQWLFFLGAEQVPELRTAPAEIGFHLAAEILTALSLIGVGTALLRRRRWAAPAALIAFGMLIYTVINSAGYFFQQGQWTLVLMFAVLFILGLRSIRQILGARL